MTVDLSLQQVLDALFIMLNKTKNHVYAVQASCPDSVAVKFRLQELCALVCCY